jgi:carbon storage regulator
MLVLTRGKSQVVVVEIGGLKMELTVLEVRGDKVKLGFQAPAEFTIDRKEVADKIKKENVSASNLTPADVEEVIEPPKFPRPA